MYRAAESAVFVWSMGITQHACGSDNVRSILNVALARGNVGRDGAGLMPIRGHSGVQGGAEMGAYATSLPGNVPIGARFRGGAGGAVRVPGARLDRADGRGDGRGGRTWRAGRAVRQRRQLPGRASRPAARRAAPRPRADADPPGHRDLEPDAGRPTARRSRGAAARRDAVRAGGRRHADDDRAPRGVQPRDPWRTAGRGAIGMADLPRPGAARRPGPRGARGVRGRAGDSRGDRPGRPVLRRHPAPGRHRRPVPVGRLAPVRRLGLPHRRRQGALHRGRSARPAPSGGAFPAVVAARQAVQLDGLPLRRSADRRRLATPCSCSAEDAASASGLRGRAP